MFGMKQSKRRETDSKNQEPGILPSSLNFAGKQKPAVDASEEKENGVEEGRERPSTYVWQEARCRAEQRAARREHGAVVNAPGAGRP